MVLVILAGARDVRAHEMFCVTVRPGDTAARLAARVTGDARNTGEEWFQILNPAVGRFVSKANYDRILSGWQACVVDGAIVTAHASSIASRPFGAARDGALRRLDSNVVLWGVLVVAIGLISHWSDQYLREQARLRTVMRRFAEAFVREFERPLVEPAVMAPPVQSQIRVTPHRARVDVWLAPQPGRRYPNLADHRQNLEYDVIRVLHTLRNPSFVSGPPYMQGRWVVVPFQLTPRTSKAGRT